MKNYSASICLLTRIYRTPLRCVGIGQSGQSGQSGKDTPRRRSGLNALIVGIFVTLLSSVSWANSALAGESRAILVMGDSISAAYGIQREQGWVQLLADTLTEKEYSWQAINASISGETTGGGLARLPGVLQETSPDIVVIELGGNDGLRGYPVKKIRENLSQMVDIVAAHGATPVIVAMRIPPNYGPRYTRAFDAVFGEVAQAKEAAFVPFILESVAISDELMQDDGIHPTAAAQPLLLDAIWQYLEPLL